MKQNHLCDMRYSGYGDCDVYEIKFFMFNGTNIPVSRCSHHSPSDHFSQEISQEISQEEYESLLIISQ